MNAVDNEAVREALINLDRSREKERMLREQANNLLEGLEIITSATGTEDMLGRLLKMVVSQLQCDDAFILSRVDQAESGGEAIEEGVELYRCIGTTHPLFSQQIWRGGQVFQRVQEGQPVMLFSTARIAEWLQQPEPVREQSNSALLISFPGEAGPILIAAVSRQRAYFKKIHLGLMQRLIPIASHALHTLHINEKLQSEIEERNRLEQYSSFQAGIADMNVSVLHNIGNSITGSQGHLLRLAHHHKSLYSLVKVLNVIESWIGDEPLPAERKRKIEQVSQGAARLLEVSVGEQGAVGEEVKALERANQHIAEIIQMQRGVSRPILTANWFRIDEMVTDTLSMIEEALEKRLIELRVEIQPPLEELCLPRNPIIQMLLNLVKNSMESVDEHKLKNPDHQGQIFVQTQQVGQGVQISVRDNGVGVEPERVETIFLFGESSKERGTGFGLHSVATFVNTVGGEIEVQSEGRGRGAIIVVRLPVNMNEQSE